MNFAEFRIKSSIDSSSSSTRACIWLHRPFDTALRLGDFGYLADGLGLLNLVLKVALKTEHNAGHQDGGPHQQRCGNSEYR